MAPPQHVTRRAFLSNLKRSGLLSREQYVEAKGLVPETDRGRVLARLLVEKGVLTRFQAERLLVGRTSGFQLDHYIILEELGRGGMGRVYKARHKNLNRTVALKILAPDLTQSERAQEMFKHEMRAIAQLVHPNIVTAFDANKVGDRYYLILEYVDGPNLDQLVKLGGPLSIGQACDFIRQAAQGLQCAHVHGMVHRDIKPANILIQRRAADGSPGLVRISDFGLAKLVDPAAGEHLSATTLTKPNTVMGTPDFLSPEQARSLKNTDIRSDLYSLGCTFYFLLTGQVPFPGGSSMEKLIRHSQNEPYPIESLRPELPPEIVAIVKKLMAKKPEERFQTPAEVAQVLEPYSVSGPTPWDSIRAAQEFVLEAVTPVEEADSDPISEAVALEGTMPASPGLTPLADSASVADNLTRSRRRRSGGGHWFIWALLLSFLLGTAAAAAYFAFFVH
jgi:serine/threonine-protein kinase